MNQKGFTLIEMLIYFGLFGLVMVGIVAATYNIFEASNRNQTRNMITAEGNFMLAKLNWAMADSLSSSVIAPTIALPTSNSLTIIKNSATIKFILSGTDFQLQRAGGPINLNSTNVKVYPKSATVFQRSNTCSTNLECLTASFTVSAPDDHGRIISEDFTDTIYLKQ